MLESDGLEAFTICMGFGRLQVAPSLQDRHQVSNGEMRIAQDRIWNRNYLCRAEIKFQAKFEGQAPFLRSKNR